MTTQAGPTILLVEDDEDTREALRRDLSGRGFRVEPVAVSTSNGVLDGTRSFISDAI